MRPDRATVTYCHPETPVAGRAGGHRRHRASLRRFTPPTLLGDALMPDILVDSRATTSGVWHGARCFPRWWHACGQGSWSRLTDSRRRLSPGWTAPGSGRGTVYHAWPREVCLRDKSGMRPTSAHRGGVQPLQGRPPAAARGQPLGGGEPALPAHDDGGWTRPYDLPLHTRLPASQIQGKAIPAYEMIKHSVCLHRGCFGGCAFCTISAHQGKFIASRSQASILREVGAWRGCRTSRDT